MSGLGPGLDGIRELGRQVVAVRWVIAITPVGQLIFLGPEPAVGNTARVTAAIVLAALLALTTRVTDAAGRHRARRCAPGTAAASTRSASR